VAPSASEGRGAVPGPEQSQVVRSVDITALTQQEWDSPRVTCARYAFHMGSSPSLTHYRATLNSPVGVLSLVATDSALIALVWRMHGHSRVPFEQAAEDAEHPVLSETTRQLHEYFAGTRRSFELPLEFRGTDFQRRVWAALLEIPYGETRTYGQIAAQLGNPAAVRAVGAANGRNPIAIIAPCHRVIGMSGDLTGFGGGLDAKAFLLALEAPQRRLLAS
jgi:methylated-DNA-[protein]-cysteine S-methyltransferase